MRECALRKIQPGTLYVQATVAKTSAAFAFKRPRPRQAAFQRAAHLLALFTLLLTCAAYAGVPDRPGWTLQFADDFNGAAGSLPSDKVWRFDLGHAYPGGPPHWGTGEIQSYTRDPANIHMDGHGHLLITPLRGPGGEWTSARIETHRDDFKPPAGGVLRMQARIQLPDVSGSAALGYWPAFWALGQNFRRAGEWPQSGEFDIMENVNGINAAWGTLHCGVLPGGPCGEPSGRGERLACEDVTCQKGFHVFAFEWDRSGKKAQLRWYLDGRLYNLVTQNSVPPATWKQITDQGGYFLLLDVAMGGGFSYALAGGVPTPTPATEPGHPMVVDYVAVWTRVGGDPGATETSEKYPDASTLDAPKLP